MDRSEVSSYVLEELKRALLLGPKLETSIAGFPQYHISTLERANEGKNISKWSIYPGPFICFPSIGIPDEDS